MKTATKSTVVAIAKSDVPALPAKSGVCLCGCGMTCSIKSYFAPGHDHRLQGYLVSAAFGGTAGLAVKFAHLIPAGGPPNKRLEHETRKAEREVRDAMKAADAKPADAKPVVDAKPKGGPGSGGVPKVKAASKPPKVTVNPALTSDERSKLGLKKSSKKGGK